MVFIPDKFADNFSTRQSSIDDEGLRVRIIEPAGATSAFGVPITTEEKSIISLQFPYNINPDTTTSSGTLGGSVTSSVGHVVLTVSTSSTSAAVLESKAALRYIAGQGSRIKFAGKFSPPTSSLMQEVGIGDALDGFFFGYSGSTFGTFRRDNGVDDWTPQTSWNVDRLNGSGSSAMTLSASLGNVYMINYQWLGYGFVNYYVIDADRGVYIPVHRIKYNNRNGNTSIQNPNLPLRMFIKNLAAQETNHSMSFSSFGAFSEGTDNAMLSDVRRSKSASRDNITGYTPILTIKNNDLFHGKKNRARMKVDYVSVSNRSQALISAAFTIDATLTSSSFQNLSVNSPASCDVSAVTASSGRDIISFEVGQSSAIRENLHDLNIRLNPNETLTVILSGSSAAVGASVSWIEEL